MPTSLLICLMLCVYVCLLNSTRTPHPYNLHLPSSLKNIFHLNRPPTPPTHLLPPTRQLTDTPHRLPPPPTSPPPSTLPCTRQTLSELPIHLLEPLEEALERENTQPGVLATRRGADGMHAQLWDTAVDGAHARRGGEHGPHGAAAAAVVADLEHLQLGVLRAGAHVGVDAALEDGGADGVGGHVGVGVGRHGGSDVEAWGVVFEVGVEEVGVDGVDDVAGDEEGVGVGAGEGGLNLGFGKGLDDALHDDGEEVASGALAEERADFLVIEEGDGADLRGVFNGVVRVEEGLDGGPRAQLVVDAAGEDELAVEAACRGRLDVE